MQVWKGAKHIIAFAEYFNYLMKIRISCISLFVTWWLCWWVTALSNLGPLRIPTVALSSTLSFLTFLSEDAEVDLRVCSNDSDNLTLSCNAARKFVL